MKQTLMPSSINILHTLRRSTGVPQNKGSTVDLFNAPTSSRPATSCSSRRRRASPTPRPSTSTSPDKLRRCQHERLGVEPHLALHEALAESSSLLAVKSG